ncbi:CG1161 [Drosophila busckii]|uniref:CG1161 n=1 Tax=Drosophila busckii TaxID=30019 RepID=A0A0M4EQH2_DROBS|nr:CG1161 [Drosophila busckii]
MANRRLFIYAALLAICYLLGVTWADAETGINSTKVSNVTQISASPAPAAKPAAAAVTPAPTITAPKVTSSKNTSSTPECACAGALLPQVGTNGKELPICAECKCSHVARNTTLIKVVVIIVIWIISILVIYMLFLMLLDPLLNKRVKASNYQEHTNEDVHNRHSKYAGIKYSPLAEVDHADEDEDDHDDYPLAQLDEPTPMPASTNNQELNARANVLNRGMDKWKRQVREQRRHIYDRHTMLN